MSFLTNMEFGSTSRRSADSEPQVPILLTGAAEIEYRSVVQVHNRLRIERRTSTNDWPVSLHTSVPKLPSACTVMTLITLETQDVAMNGL